MGLVRHRSSGGAHVRVFARVSQLALSLATRLHVRSYQRAWPLWSVIKRDVCTWRWTRHFSTYTNIDMVEITHSARHKTVPPRGFHEPGGRSGDQVIQLQQNLMNKPQVLVKTFLFAVEGSVHLLWDAFGCDFRTLWIKMWLIDWSSLLLSFLTKKKKKRKKRHNLKCQMYNISFQHIILFCQIFKKNIHVYSPSVPPN